MDLAGKIDGNLKVIYASPSAYTRTGPIVPPLSRRVNGTIHSFLTKYSLLGIRAAQNAEEAQRAATGPSDGVGSVFVEVGHRRRERSVHLYKRLDHPCTHRHTYTHIHTHMYTYI